jgi:excinuclease ABC subunit B
VAKFQLKSDYKPFGDQPQAIEELIKSLDAGNRHQILHGVTGSGKTFTMANVIARTNRPALVIAPNKTLAAQLCAEFREFFPHNAVEYFVSYYDYYQPEAYVPRTDTYIEKDSSINEEIDRLRNSATRSILLRRDVVVVASVSCIYGLGQPEAYIKAMQILKKGQKLERDELIKKLISMQYERNSMNVERGSFRARGETLDVMLAGDQKLIRITWDDDCIKSLSEVHPVSGAILQKLEEAVLYPATQYVTSPERMEEAFRTIESELAERLEYFRKNNMLLEAQRIEQRTKFDLEMIRELGYCSGIENYSRHLDGRKAGDPPGTLLDFFPKDFLMFIDESHIAVSQAGGMYAGDRARKDNLVNYGFRLPSALDNRPLNFQEFEARMGQTIYVSATPGPYEIEKVQKTKGVVVQQVIRPTCLTDPEVEVHPMEGQIDHLMIQIRERIAKHERVLVVTLTKRMSEDLTAYFLNNQIKSRYMHSDIDTLERLDILRGLRLGDFDVLVGINLLREGLDLPEVSLVAIMDADQEGFLRSERSLIQIIGRSARNVNGRVLLYANRMTDSMKKAIDETNRRRQIQKDFNIKHGLTPQSIQKQIKDIRKRDESLTKITKGFKKVKPADLPDFILKLEKEMLKAAENLEFEKAALIRDQLEDLKAEKVG